MKERNQATHHRYLSYGSFPSHSIFAGKRIRTCRSDLSQDGHLEEEKWKVNFRVLGQEMFELRSKLGEWILARIEILESDSLVGFAQGMARARCDFYCMTYAFDIQVIEGIAKNAPTRQDNVLVEYPAIFATQIIIFI